MVNSQLCKLLLLIPKYAFLIKKKKKKVSHTSLHHLKIISVSQEKTQDVPSTLWALHSYESIFFILNISSYSLLSFYWHTLLHLLKANSDLVLQLPISVLLWLLSLSDLLTSCPMNLSLSHFPVCSSLRNKFHTSMNRLKMRSHQLRAEGMTMSGLRLT